MPSKRKRDIEDFDPNKSDSDDENFDPTQVRTAPRTKKRSRGPPNHKSGSKRGHRYRGSDIDDDGEEVSDEESFAEDDDEEEEDEDDEDAPMNAAGRRTRKAATTHNTYKESSEDEDAQEPSESEPEVLPTTSRRRRGTRQLDEEEEKPEAPVKPARLIVKLRAPVGRMTRRRTEEAEENLVELSNSGRHVNAVPRASKSKSPETAAKARSSRAMKSVKQPPSTIEEATQEDITRPVDPDEDELAGDTPGEPEVAQPDDVKESTEAVVDVDDDDDDVVLPARGRATRASRANILTDVEEPPQQPTGRRLTRGRLAKSKSFQEQSSDFEPGEESHDDVNMSDASGKKARPETVVDSPTPRGRRGKERSARGSRRDSEEEPELDQDELADELDELRADSRSRTRRRRRPSPAIIYQENAKRRRAAARPMNYYMPPLSAVNIEEDAQEDPAPTPARRRGGRGAASTIWDRPLNTTFGPFGGGGAGSLLTGPWGAGAAAAGGVDSDSSDDEMGHRGGAAGNVGMTPTTAGPAGLLPGLTHAGADIAGVGAAPNVGKIKNTKALADADPLGVDLNVDFDSVGGLQGHIDQLKEMVQLPLLYPELFQRFHVTPPRGVLFHGPPGTGKTLLARALANAMGVGGRKITFYMRKGADALSKWVGEAEKQLRLLFEEARRTQPSIIFFDEIDGLAPVRSSKQEQIHASIVSTLLALMDGMDGRGQVIVIGATNRPDNIDPALRRPGRFDREFYFPLPDLDSRLSILNIHTKDWGMAEPFKRALAENTKGYGGADLRALCTEAALNAIQRSYPQIYSSQDKLIVDPAKIDIHATDFMISIKKMIPSSERSAGAAAAPLPKSVEPLLRDQFGSIKAALDNLMPRKKKITALEEAMYEQFEDRDHGFGREALHQEFERSRIFRPRFLIHGLSGMGQNYLASALLHHFEGVHVQNFGLPNILADGRPMEQVIVGFFTEVKRHKPSVIYIPNVESWFETVKDTVAYITFKAMLKSISPTDPVLVLATAEYDQGSKVPGELLRDIFAFSKKNQLEIVRPKRELRHEYFGTVVDHIRKSPADFPDPANRKKRVLEVLPVAPPPPPKVPTKEEVKNMQKRDHQLLNILKVQLQPIMDQINRKYKKFRQPVIAAAQLEHLFAESDPNYVRPDVAEGEVRPFEITKDKYGSDVLRETATGKIYYNLETTTIEERLSNGYYCRPDDFLRDIKSLAKDAKNVGDKERTLKANELVSNVEVDVASIAANTATIDWEALRQRQIQRAKVAAEKERKRKAMQSIVDRVQSDVAGDSDSQGPVMLGEPIPGSHVTTRFQLMSPPPQANGAEDVPMGGVEDETQVHSPNQAMRPPSQWPVTEPRSADDSAMATGAITQRSIITTVPPGVSLSAIANDASTTKTSDPSQRSSGSKWSTTNGHANNDDTSDLPDTLELPAANIPPSQAPAIDDNWAQSQSAQSQVEAPRSVNKVGSLGNILNDSSEEHYMRHSGASSQPLVIDEGAVIAFLEDVTTRTSGCTIEQLEQISRELMDGIWRTRDEWNRLKVMSELKGVFNDTIGDIEQMQAMMQSTPE
ncbi:ATPase [Plectosphaerella plurivora]|uniref:ATPase n=1 Tax=Plectosphaerella plurivora TaxID=936078 RepID=A0A9P8UZU5_9PEZI|nr:ATPase [Plectosphaerella plurivora]